jgi:glycosyltransferase involved in cell wall biosynthesis
MQIVHVAPLYHPSTGGGELHIKALSECLVSRGHEVTVLTTDARDPWQALAGKAAGLPRSETINGVSVVRFPPDGATMGRAVRRWQNLGGGYRSSALAFGTDGLEYLLSGPITLQMVSRLVRCRPQIAASIVWMFPAAYHLYLARRLQRFIHVGFPLFHTMEKWAHRSVYRRMLTSCDAIVTNTEHEAEFARARGARRLLVGGVGVHAQKFRDLDGDRIRARHGIGQRPVVGFVGRQISQKGATQVLRAMGAVWAWNSEVRLILAGSRPPQPNEVDAEFDKLSPVERSRIVRVPDFPEEEKAALYSAFDVFALPSVSESFGISYLEAWMCRKAVIGARIPSTSCVIDEGLDGLLVDPADSHALAGAIISLLGDRETRERMGYRGQAKVRERFTWEKVTDRVEELYLQLLDRHRAVTRAYRCGPLRDMFRPSGSPPPI